MDANRVETLRKDLRRFLGRFDDCFARSEGRGHLRLYVGGQVSSLERKSVEPMADRAGVPPRTLQDFLAFHTWDHERAVDRLQQIVVEAHHDEQAVGLIDETSYAKRGDHTVGVQRQWCGAMGKVDNCVVSVALGYATLRGDFRCTLDHRPYLPKSWADDAERRAQAGVPESAEYRPKWRIALDMLRRAQSNGVRLAWLTFDEWYGRNIEFLTELDAMGQSYVAEVPRDSHGWLVEPRVLQKEHHPQRSGRRRHYPRLMRQSAPPNRVDVLCRYSPAMRDQPWVNYHVKDGHKGPIVWKVKAARFWISRQVDGAHHGRMLPSAPRWLIMARNAVTGEVKYFVSNAPPGVPLERIVHVAFCRWHVERGFQDEKDELGLDHFECRRYQAVQRHLILTAISHLFLSRTRLQLIEEGQARGGKNPDRAAGAPRHRGGVPGPDDAPLPAACVV
jgi:SRSO17 transposase